jgi:hypothetical protein
LRQELSNQQELEVTFEIELCQPSPVPFLLQARRTRRIVSLWWCSAV